MRMAISHLGSPFSAAIGFHLQQQLSGTSEPSFMAFAFFLGGALQAASSKANPRKVRMPWS